MSSAFPSLREMVVDFCGGFSYNITTQTDRERTMKKVLLIVNPLAGMRKVNRQLTDIINVLNRADWDVCVHITGGRLDAMQQILRRASSVDAVICCGGDGTFNETLTGVLNSKQDIPIGYIPTGSTNDFASSLHLPLDPVKAAQMIAEGKPERYDVGMFGNRYFSYVASFGAFTKASYSTPQNVKNTLGHTAYVLEGIQELSQIRKIPMRLELDGETVIEDDFIFGAICNSTSVGGILTLDPKQVDMRDGMFEVLLVRAPKDLSEIGECIQALQKQSYNCRMITFRTAKNIVIHASPDVPWTLDGEKEEGHAQVEVKNLHCAIGLIR